MSEYSGGKINLFSTFDGTTGGQAINAAIFSCEFSKRGYKVKNICYARKNINLELRGDVLSLKVPFVNKIKNPYLNIVVKPVQVVFGIVNFWRLFRGQPKQKIICFGWGASLVALFSKTLFRIKNIDIICRVGTQFKEELASERFWLYRVKSKLVDWMIGWLYKKAFLVSPVSEHLKKFLLEEYGVLSENIVVMHNPRDENNIIKLSREEVKAGELFSNCITIITCGRLTLQKAQWHLIRAFSVVRQKIPCRLLILGDGELKDYLKKLSKDLGLENDMLFLGHQENPYKYFSKADVFVLSSFWEGFPNVLLEAMICGLPVVSSDCPSGPREILAPNTDLNYRTDKVEHAKYGILLPVPDKDFYDAKASATKEESALALAILEMLEDNKLRLKYKEKAISRARDFSIEKVIDSWTQLIENK